MAEDPVRHTVRGSPRPPDKLRPYMPAVNLLPDLELDRLFSSARHVASDAQRGFALVTPARQVVRFPAPPPGKEATQLSRKVFGETGPLDITVVTYTDVEALKLDPPRTIPFFGFLGAFAAAGHRVVAFEGHPTALAAGVRGADALLVDSGMLPFLQSDWKHVAFEGMRGDVVLVHDRASYKLLKLLPPGPRGTDFTPRMPEPENPERLAAALDEARRIALDAGARRVAVIAPDRSVFALDCPAASAVSAANGKLVEGMAPGEPLDAVAIACNIPALLREDARRAFPSIDLVLGLGTRGHRVVLFEGHPSAFETVVSGADLLVVDGGMEPRLPADWVTTARRVMRRARIVVLTRDGLVLLWGAGAPASSDGSRR